MAGITDGWNLEHLQRSFVNETPSDPETLKVARQKMNDLMAYLKKADILMDDFYKRKEAEEQRKLKRPPSAKKPKMRKAGGLAWIQTVPAAPPISINPGAYTLEIQPRPGEEVTEKIPITMSDSSEDEENADNIDSDDSMHQKAAVPTKGSTPKRGRSPDKRKAKKEAAKQSAKSQATEAQKKPAKSEVKQPAKPQSDSTVKTPKPNPAKRHKSSDDLDISDAGPQRTEQMEKAQEPHDKEAVERKFKEVMERTGTKPAKTSGGRLRNPPRPPTPPEQSQPSTSKQQSDVESDQASDLEDKDSISDHGDGDPYEGFKGDMKEMFNHGADTDESQWPAPDDVRASSGRTAGGPGRH
ncbi:neurofilament heavy polypeptide-like [Paramacrobiotus metropolitanus]|uniref:neurofilament heavy polypeptide-like n=1 Tax=Paramacrobiotus metropolitanus TaxID=2943436 RepID=UPI0024462DEE|nr:neurofilament heavy polypeptide-like [Paramacrobiotus metropolitanus]